MREVTIYLDVWPGNDADCYASLDPGPPMDGRTRYAITVKIPDVNKPDATLPVDEIKEVDKDLS